MLNSKAIEKLADDLVAGGVLAAIDAAQAAEIMTSSLDELERWTNPPRAQVTPRQNRRHVINCNRGDSLAALIKAFPDAQVEPLLCENDQDGWRVTIVIAGDEVAAAAAETPVIYRVLSKSTPSYQPDGSTFWQRVPLYCGPELEPALSSYWAAKPEEHHRGPGGSVFAVVIERIEAGREPVEIDPTDDLAAAAAADIVEEGAAS